MIYISSVWMCKFKVAQIPSSRVVNWNFQHSKLKPYTIFLNLWFLSLFWIVMICFPDGLDDVELVSDCAGRWRLCGAVRRLASCTWRQCSMGPHRQNRVCIAGLGAGRHGVHRLITIVPFVKPSTHLILPQCDVTRRRTNEGSCICLY